MDKLDVTKKVVAWVATYGTGIIVKQIIANNLPLDLPVHKKIGTAVGGFVIGAMVSDAVEAKTDAMIDFIVEHYEKFKDELDK